MQRSAPVAEVLGSVIGLRGGGVTVRTKEGLRERLDDPGERVGLAATAASEPRRSAVVRRCRHRQVNRRGVIPRVEALLKRECQECHSIGLLLGTLGVRKKLAGHGGGSLRGQG